MPEASSVPSFVRPARAVLYGLLLLAAVVTFTGLPALEEAVRQGRQRPAALMVAPALFALFIVLFATYRFVLVRARRYHAGKAFVQVGLMALALTLLLPGSLERYHALVGARPVELERALSSPDPDARAMAAELVRHRERSVALSHVPRLVALLDDRSPEVRRQARESLTALAGGDQGAESPERWRDYWRSQGLSLP
jgi:hypothetical protein